MVTLYLSLPAKAVCTTYEADNPKTLIYNTEDPNPGTAPQRTDAATIILQQGTEITTTGDNDSTATHAIYSSTTGKFNIILEKDVAISTAGAWGILRQAKETPPDQDSGLRPALILL